MKTLNATQPLSSGSFAPSFESARALAFSIAESGNELIKPELIAWNDRTTAMASPVLEGCSSPYGWRDYGLSHGGRLEVDVDGKSTFIFAESSPFDSYEHFGHGPFINIRDVQGGELICQAGGVDCIPLDEWTSKLT